MQNPFVKSKRSSKAVAATVVQSQRQKPDVNWQHLWSQDEAKLATAESLFSRVPNEVLLQIFKYLNVHDLGSVSAVCRLFKMIADQDEIWKSKVNISLKLHSKSFKQIYMDWMYEKYLRNAELQEVERHYLERSSYVACGLQCPPPQYPMRPQSKRSFVPFGEFKQHPNESQEMSIQLSVDIDKTARELISLLEKASIFQNEWRQSSVVKQMITRYYRFLQLKSSNPNLLLIPTLDIEMIWQTHLLRPQMYQTDCMRLFHRVIDHSLLLNDVEQCLKEQAFIDTCRLYEERFGEDYCPLPEPKDPTPKYVHHVFSKLQTLIPIYSYWDETYFKFSEDPAKAYDENPFSFTEADVILDGNWLGLCKQFLKDMLKKVSVSATYGCNLNKIELRSNTLNRLKKSYERFLYMSVKYPPTNGYAFIHPTYAIDIIWHSHMQEPLKYASDCIRLIGYVIDHAPWPSVDEQQMKDAYNDTEQAWKKEFASEMKTDHLYNTAGEGYDWWDD